MALFEIYLDDEELIYHSQSPSPEVKLVNPKLTLEDNAAGSFTCSIPTSNRGYNKINRLTSEFVVYRDKEEIWAGRIIDERQDFWGNRQITCEGELAYLNDTTQPPSEYHNQTVRGFLSTLISKHNAKVLPNRTFRVGVVTVTDPNDSIYRYTNFESTLECIADKLVDRLGGHIRIRKENGVRYIDYLESSMNTNTQTIEFGKNLVDFSKSWDLTDFATVVVPQGARLDESPIEALDAYLDVSSVNNGSIYVYDQTTVDNYGWIETIVKWDDVTVASNLLTKAKKYLSEMQFENMVLELSAVDLHYMNVNTEAIGLLDEVHCISRPHGMDKMFPVTKLDIPMDNPDNTVFTLGDNTEKTSLSGAIKTGNSKLQQQIDELPSTTSVLDEAKENADQIMRQNSNGYITTVLSDVGGTHSEKLVISNTKNYLNATKYWVWSADGLAYYNKNKSSTPQVAITMDGAISANFITTGTMSADRVRAGILSDTQGNITWNLNTGAMVAKNLSINSTNFYISNDGHIQTKDEVSWGERYVDIYAGKLEITYNSTRPGNINKYTTSFENGGILFYKNGKYYAELGISSDNVGMYINDGSGLRLENDSRNIYIGTHSGNIVMEAAGGELSLWAVDKIRMGNGYTWFDSYGEIYVTNGCVHVGENGDYNIPYWGDVQLLSYVNDAWLDWDTGDIHWNAGGYILHYDAGFLMDVESWD